MSRSSRSVHSPISAAWAAGTGVCGSCLRAASLFSAHHSIERSARASAPSRVEILQYLPMRSARSFTPMEKPSCCRGVDQRHGQVARDDEILGLVRQDVRGEADDLLSVHGAETVGRREPVHLGLQFLEGGVVADIGAAGSLRPTRAPCRATRGPSSAPPRSCSSTVRRRDDQSWTKSGAASDRLKAASQTFSSVPPRNRAPGAAFRASRKRWCQRLTCRILSALVPRSRLTKISVSRASPLACFLSFSRSRNEA